MLLSVAACQLWLPLTQCLHKVFSPLAMTLRLASTTAAEIGPASAASFLKKEKEKKKENTKKPFILFVIMRNYMPNSSFQLTGTTGVSFVFTPR